MRGGGEPPGGGRAPGAAPAVRGRRSRRAGAAPRVPRRDQAGRRGDAVQEHRRPRRPLGHAAPRELLETRPAGAEPAGGRRRVLCRLLLGRDPDLGERWGGGGVWLRGAGRAGGGDAAAALRAGAHGVALRGAARRVASPGGRDPARDGPAQDVGRGGRRRRRDARLLPTRPGPLAGAAVPRRGLRRGETPPGQPVLRNTTVISERQCFTIEPGIYFIDALLRPLREGPLARTVDWKLVDALAPLGGIRIEDDVVVHSNGLRNLTRESLPIGGGRPD